MLKSAHLGASQKSATAGLLTQQKSATLQKVDLASLAGKLQLLNQPANPAPSQPSQSPFLQNSSSTKLKVGGNVKRRSSVKFNSRKNSTQQKEFEASHKKLVPDAGDSRLAQPQESARVFSADGNLNRKLVHATPRPKVQRLSQRAESAGHTFEQVAAQLAHPKPSLNYHTSRNGAPLQTATTQPLTVKVASALKDLSLTPASKHTLFLVPSATMKAMQSCQQLPTAQLNSMPQVALKQELRVHSRKSSGVHALSKATGHNAAGASSAVKKGKRKQ